MKNGLLILFTLISLYSFGEKGPKIKFEKDVYDFGKVEKGNVAKYTFKFKNTGTEPLVLVNVRPSCGCTSPVYTKEPILPGAQGQIEIAFNSSNANGTFAKSISVTTNIPDQTNVLYIKGEVIDNPADNPGLKSPVRIQE